MTPTHDVLRWSRATPTLLVIAVIACSDRSVVTGERKHMIDAQVVPIYDSTGQPQSTYYSG